MFRYEHWCDILSFELFNLTLATTSTINYAKIHWRNLGQVAQERSYHNGTKLAKQIGWKEQHHQQNAGRNNNFSKHKSQLSVTKRQNIELTKHIVTMKDQCWANAKYSRKDCFEIVGIPHQADNNQLETKVLSLF